jgi:hypothetical protein
LGRRESDSASPARTAFFRMSETSHLKCPCQKCGEAIEFPAQGVGLSVTCPHCGTGTTLFAVATSETLDAPDAVADPSSPDASFDSRAAESAAPSFDADESVAGNGSPGSKRRLLWVVLPLLALAGAAGFFFRDRLARPKSPAVSESSPATNLETTKVVSSALANAPASPKALKSIDDLKVGPVTLEKSKGSSLVYAVGVLRNDSAHQRFGVNLELELADARGNKAGTAKDYRAVLEPRQEWRFRALVLDSKAVSAKVATVREEE